MSLLRGLLTRLEGDTNPLPDLTLSRCLRERQAVGGCEVCAEVCPHGAVRLGELGASVEIDPAACTGCGLCVQACPSGALEYPLEPPLLALRDQREAGQEALTLACAPSGAGGPQVPCLGRVTPGLLAAASAWGPLTLLRGECGVCAVGSARVPEQLAGVIEVAAALRAATTPATPLSVEVRPAGPQDADLGVRVSRRGAFAALWRGGRAQLARSAPALPFLDPHPEGPRAAGAADPPQDWAWRGAVARLAPPGSAVPWPAPVVDESCIDCPVCANVCPTSAITRERRPDGGVELLLNLGACTGCGACIRSCPPQAMHEQTAWLPEAFAAPLLLRESDSVL